MTAVMLSRPPASFACVTSVVQATSGSGWARSVASIASWVSISVNPSEQEQQSITRLDVDGVSLHLDACVGTTHDICDDVAKTVSRGLFGVELSPTDQLRGECVIPRDLLQLSLAVYVRAAVTHMDDTELGAKLIRHGHGRPHPIRLGMLGRLLHDPSIRLT